MWCIPSKCQLTFIGLHVSILYIAKDRILLSSFLFHRSERVATRGLAVRFRAFICYYHYSNGWLLFGVLKEWVSFLEPYFIGPYQRKSISWALIQFHINIGLPVDTVWLSVRNNTSGIDRKLKVSVSIRTTGQVSRQTSLDLNSIWLPVQRDRK